MKIAILDDYQNVSQTLADWAEVKKRAEVTVFNDHLSEAHEVVKRLMPFDIVCIMRERTPMSASILSQLKNLKLIVSTGSRNASIDMDAALKNDITVLHTNYFATPTIEHTWALILASARNIPAENSSLKSNGWQQHIGTDLHGKTLGLLGLGNIGSKVAAIGKAFGMRVISWSQNLTEEKALEGQAILVSKEELFKQADFLSVHLVLGDRSRGLVGSAELSLMKPTSYLINTSRGPIVKEQDLISALKNKTIRGAAIDVYDIEPLPKDHPYRSLENLLATPHIGYVSEDLYKTFYRDSVENILKWLDHNYN